MISRPGRPFLLLFLCLLVLNSAVQAGACGAVEAAERTAPNSGGGGAAAAKDTSGGAAVRLRPVLAASAFLLAAAAVVLEIESDRAYESYLGTADPRRMDTYYDTAERKGDLSTAALIGAELSAATLVVTYLFQKRPAEPAPGSVIIGLAAVPGGVGVRFRW